MKHPPFGKQFQPAPPSGVRVAIGPGAWDFAKELGNIPNGWNIPIMVLSECEAASNFTWPSDGGPALIYEIGEYNDDRLDELAGELLRAGSPSVVAIRDALLNDFDPRVFYDAEVFDVAA
jgi:hypothetical protein